MKESNTAERLKEIMNELCISQRELVDLCQPYCKKYNQKIDKSYISRYLSGDYEPKQKKLTILALALNINETWLMGYDVPKERQKSEKENTEIKEVIEKLRKLDLFDLGKISNQIDTMLEAEKYRKEQDLKTA